MKYLLTFLMVSILLGCQDVKRPEKPDNLIDREKMVGILTDAYLSNAARSIDNKSIRSEGIRLDSFIYKKYGIDSIQFVRSNAYYTSNLNDYNDLFANVKERLLKIQIRTDSLNVDLENEKDSLDNKPQLIQPTQIDSVQPSIE